MISKKRLAALLMVAMLTVPTVTHAEGTNTNTTPTPATSTSKSKSTNVGDRIKQAQTNAAKREATQQERNEIKDIYAQMKNVETNNHQTYLQILDKRKQVKAFIQQVSQGKIAYTDDQLNQITSLSDILTNDVQALKPFSETIKTDEANVKTSCQNKDYTTAINDLNTELGDRKARGAALIKVSGDLDSMLAILTQGQAVANPT